mgnify:CR=1 FL=1
MVRATPWIHEAFITSVVSSCYDSCEAMAFGLTKARTIVQSTFSCGAPFQVIMHPAVKNSRF